MTASEQTAVRVAVRVRPQTARERSNREKDCIACNVSTRQAIIGERSFTFDYLFDPTSTQQDIYNQSVRPLVDAALSGYNATVFAYGQTGSGKTYTMGSSDGLTEDDLGMLPRALKQIFEERVRREQSSSMILRASFLEIHNEELRDLLSIPSTLPFGMGARRATLQIREDPQGGIYFAGAEEREVDSFRDMCELLEQGTARRAVGSTEMNAHSSRSHAIFTLIIEQRLIRESDFLIALNPNDVAGTEDGANVAEEEYIVSKFHFVDLAGSERLKKTKAEGERLKEGININSGLLALGNVISALGDEQKRHSVHVPYRDSKLTRMLQDSLGGNSRTLMIACVSPVDSNSEESLNTLKYANRARNIKNTPIINRDPNSHLIAQLRKEISTLRIILKEHGIYHTSLQPGSPNQNFAHTSISMHGVEGENDGEGSDDNMKSIIQNLEMQLIEQSRLVDSFKLAMAEIYSCTEKLQDEAQILRNSPLVTKDSSLCCSLTQIEKLLNGIQEIEAKCRTKAVLRAASQSCFGHPSGCVSRTVSSGLPNDYPMYSPRVVTSLTPRSVNQEVSSEDNFHYSPRPHGELQTAGIQLPTLGLSQLNECGDLDDAPLTDRSMNTGDASARQLQDISDLDAVLVEKERLLQELVRNQREFDTMRSVYEKKMEDLQHSIRAIEEERDATVKELESMDKHKTATTTSELHRERWNTRLRQLEEELKRMKKKVKDHERLLAFKEQGDQKIANLAQEVDRLKASRAQLHKKMAIEAKGHREQRQALEKQILSLRKADLASKRTIRELEIKLSSAARAEHVVKRKAQIALEKQKNAERESETSDSNKNQDVLEWFQNLLQRATAGKDAENQIQMNMRLRAQLESEMNGCTSRLKSLDTKNISEVEFERQKQDFYDELEYLSAELEFRTLETEKSRKLVNDCAKVQLEIQERLPRLSDSDVKRLIVFCYEQLNNEKQQSIDCKEQLQESESMLVELRRSLEESRLALQSLDRKHDAALTHMQREYESKLMFVFEQLEEANRNNVPRSVLDECEATDRHRASDQEPALREESYQNLATKEAWSAKQAEFSPKKEVSSHQPRKDAEKEAQYCQQSIDSSMDLSGAAHQDSDHEGFDQSKFHFGRERNSASRLPSTDAKRTSGTSTSSSCAIDVSAVQNMVIEKADRILASSRSASGGSGQLTGGSNEDSQVPQKEPIKISKLPLDKLKKSSPEVKKQTGSLSDRSNYVQHRHPVELSYAADVLGMPKSSRKEEPVKQAERSAKNAKVDKKGKSEELRIMLSHLWDALDIPESHRSKFRSSSKVS
eukprot:754072-Hanusia_phi.AAC.2